MTKHPLASLYGAVWVGTLLSVAANGCARPSEEPDERALATMVAKIVINDATMHSTEILIMSETGLSALSSEVRSALEVRLDGANGGWELLQEAPRSIEDWPGEWETSELGGLVNSTYLLVEVNLRGDGNRRRLNYARSCGELCSFGEEIELWWEDGIWHSRTVATLVS